MQPPERHRRSLVSSSQRRDKCQNRQKRMKKILCFVYCINLSEMSRHFDVTTFRPSLPILIPTITILNVYVYNRNDTTHYSAS